MEAMPKKAVWTVAAALVALALLGTYQGWRRSALDEAQTAADGSLLPVAPAVKGARPAAALVEAPVVFSEAQIREFARQEARAALRGSEPVVSEAAPEAPSVGPAAAGQPPAPVAGPARPTPATPPAEAPAEGGTAAAPLF